MVAQPQIWALLCLLWLATTQPTSSSQSQSQEHIAKPGCNNTCGNITIPYPFGINNLKCAKNKSFLLNCTHTNTSSSTSPPELLLSNIPILTISVKDSTIKVSIDSAFDCYDGSSKDNHFTQTLYLDHTPFTFSAARNKFTAVGCDIMALMQEPGGRFMSGCNSFCTEPQVFTSNSSCSGIGCCQSPLPKHVKTLDIEVSSMSNHTTYSNFHPCSYGFLAETESLDLSDFDLSSKKPQYLARPVILDWVVSGEKDCGSSCGGNAKCVYSENALGYYCVCKGGNFVGNPYLPQGCQDVNECEESREKYPCHGRCKNTIGNYTCLCPFGMEGDGKVSCQLVRAVKIIAGVGSVTTFFVISLLTFILCKRRSKERNFIKNGGMMLKHQRVRIFSEAELVKATNNFDNANLLGEGGFGSVYKGIVEGNLQVAVKKPKDENKIEVSTNFYHEIATVSQVNHKNVVKLLGLCLETKVPILVYEFVSNGTLFEHIHDGKSTILCSWKSRLRVASESALAFDYLHSLANPPIIHRDIKSMNILLDDNYTAKVSDFGTSVLMSPGEAAMATNIKGTFGYLDPEYLMTGILTDKSDVYSFGVVLMELLTGEKPISTERSGEKRNITQYFISSAENGKLFKNLGFDLSDEGDEEEIGLVAELVKRCLNPSGVKRPSMKEVAEQLASVIKLNKSVMARGNDVDETEKLLGEPSDHFLCQLQHSWPNDETRN